MTQQQRAPVSRTVDISEDTPPGGFLADDTPPPDTEPEPAPLRVEIRALAKDVKALHGEFQLLRADVTAKLSQRQLVLSVAKYGGTVLLTALTTLAPKWAPILAELLKALGQVQ